MQYYLNLGFRSEVTRVYRNNTIVCRKFNNLAGFTKILYTLYSLTLSLNNKPLP